ncbi:hypothetical protein FHS85_003170 [Rhodoligotrophos appendicifer]
MVLGSGRWRSLTPCAMKVASSSVFAKVTSDMTEREEARRRQVDSEAQYRQFSEP